MYRSVSVPFPKRAGASFQNVRTGRAPALEVQHAVVLGDQVQASAGARHPRQLGVHALRDAESSAITWRHTVRS